MKADLIIFIDDNLRLPGVNLFIKAFQLKVLGASKLIDLSGAQGDDFKEFDVPAKVISYDKNGNGLNGTDGQPGRPG